MKRLFHLTVGLCVLFVVLLLAIELAGRRFGSPLFALLFTNVNGSGCDTCLLGVDWDTAITQPNAEQLMVKHPLLKGFPPIVTGGNKEFFGDNFVIYYDGIFQKETEIYLEPHVPKVDGNRVLDGILVTAHLADAINLWGVPQFVQTNGTYVIWDRRIDKPFVYLSYPAHHAILIFERSANGAVAPDNVFFGIEFFASDDMPDPNRSGYAYSIAVPLNWRGFGPGDLYPSLPYPTPTDTP